MLPLVARISPAVAAVMVDASSQPAQIPLGIELFVVVVSSASGVLSARQNKLDYIGALWMALLVGLGGGLLRDIILQVGDVYILQEPLAIPISIIAATIVFVFPMIVEKSDRLLEVLDIFSVGLYAVMGADKAMVYDFDPAVCIMMGFFTAVGGGMLRDICLAKTPNIFLRGNFYAIAAIAGSASYILLVDGLGLYNMAALVMSTCITMGLRWISMRYNILSPIEVDLSHMVPHGRRGNKVSAETSHDDEVGNLERGLAANARCGNDRVERSMQKSDAREVPAATVNDEAERQPQEPTTAERFPDDTP